MNRADAFREQLDTLFEVEHPTGPIRLRLTEVTIPRPGGGIQQFSLFFQGAPDSPLSQGSYTFRHDALGSLLLFIVPILGSNAERIVYQACFSVPVGP